MKAETACAHQLSSRHLLFSDFTAYSGMESENEAQLTGKQARGTL